MSTLILSLIIANLLGVIISLWFVSRPRGDSEEIAATLAQALDAGGDFPDSTNGTHSARSPLIRALNRKGDPVEYTGTGLLARAFCHEIDHLDGVIFTDNAVRMLTEEEISELEGE